MAGKILFDESYLEARGTGDPGGRLSDPRELAELRSSIEKTVAPTLEVSRPPAAVAARSDRLVPVAATVGALLAIGVTAAVATISLRHEVVDLALKAYGHTSGEGRVLQQYREDSERRIREKDSEVRSVLKQLEDLRRNSASLTSVVERGIDIRESQMSDAVAGQLARERAQLAASGAAAAETEARLSALRQRLELEADAELERLRREGEEALAAQRVQLLASVERATLELARAAASGAANTARPPRVEPPAPPEDLAVTREIASGLASALGLIEKSDYGAASTRLAQVRRLLSGDPAALPPSVAARRAADLEVVKALESYMTVLRAQKPPVPASVPAPPAPSALGPIIGRVTLVEGRRIVIEALVATPVASGAVLRILRLDSQRTPRDVVRAQVVDVSGTRIVAYVDGNDLPSITDLVHLSGP